MDFLCVQFHSTIKLLYLLHQIQTIQPIRKLTYLYRLNKNNDPNMIGAPI